MRANEDDDSLDFAPPELLSRLKAVTDSVSDMATAFLTANPDDFAFCSRPSMTQAGYHTAAIAWNHFAFSKPSFSRAS